MVHSAFADIAASIDPKPQKHRCAARPLLEHVARKIAPREDGSGKMRGLGDPIVAAAA